MADLPSGAVTFLFTDIEGSTPLVKQHSEIGTRTFSRNISVCFGPHSRITDQSETRAPDHAVHLTFLLVTERTSPQRLKLRTGTSKSSGHPPRASSRSAAPAGVTLPVRFFRIYRYLPRIAVLVAAGIKKSFDTRRSRALAPSPPMSFRVAAGLIS